ncbi:iron-containing redox enzyme family protein [Gloeothece verrucosa]|uniref:Cupin 2 conserved barrel domain protein n=1 Tax=Gloeothece verrucosa (strain PCC 7822) TaxID=497965 RepID=E0UKP1_GLOV7|nr:iron-containing redox enzyme family protein [Gloeothece verrucosa]ADN17521.1 Cupin 2 conserved barrel domain protein [Gloeothece verrucosa PCC 7822]
MNLKEKELVNSLKEHSDYKKRCLTTYISSPLFGHPDNIYCDSPYVRPCRPQDLDENILFTSLSQETLDNPNHLLAQRLLLNIYEQDSIFLPQAPRVLNFKKFQSFYDAELMACGHTIRPELEHFLFDWLEKSIHIEGPWNLETFIAYTDSILKKIAQSESQLYKELTASQDPQSAARFYLIQCAGDFLSEASAMGKNVLGNFGSHTSELFKILIDEYGYGVHQKKHSSIFEELLKQAGLSHHIHHYWQFYTPKSIALINYFHYVSANHGSFFRYLGAMYFTEATLAYVTRAQSKAIKEIFSGNVCTQYFDEHSHIDIHHGRMALNKLILPLVKEYGNKILPEILRGFEEFQLLQDVADKDLFAHIKWHDQLNEYKQKANFLRPNYGSDMSFTEKKGELSVTHIHPVDELFWVEEGEIEFIVSPDKSILLKAGEGIVIPQGMLHGSLVVSEHCQYTVTSLELRK